MITISRYTEENKSDWDRFCQNAKQPLFMFERDYMDYHKDRFFDHSLLFYEDDRLIALLPMCEKGDSLVSHGGLTYGGFITDEKMKQHKMLDCFAALNEYAKHQNKSEVLYKTIPHIFHRQPAEEDRYALFRMNASIVSVSASTVINLKDPLKFPKGRKAQVTRAKREGVVVEELDTYEAYCEFIQLENAVLSEHHNTRAVHTADELYLLHTRFPEQIRLFAAIKNNTMIAGVVIYEYDQIVHTQYMAANEEARVIGGLDLVVSYLIEKYKPTKMWFDFGISTEDGGRYLNEGLCAQKEGFGGRTVVYECWNLKANNKER